ncbi:unnamed protein product [Closterium sp. NIES-54]
MLQIEAPAPLIGRRLYPGPYVSCCPAATRTACPPRKARPAAAPRVALCCSAPHALLQPARRALLPCASRPAAASALRPTAASASRSAALSVAPCYSQRVAPYCSQRVAPCCPARRALLQPARRALLQPVRRALLPCTSRPAAASVSRPTAASASRSAAPHVAPCCSQRVVPYCSQRVALCCPTRRALLPCPPRALSCSPWHALPSRAAPPNLDHQTLKSTGTYVDEVPPPGANIVDGTWIFRVKRPPGSTLAFKARYVARGFSQRQGVDFFQTFSTTLKMTTLQVLLHIAAHRDYELHSLDFSTAFLQGSLHEEIWLRHPPGFTGSFAVGTQWSLRRPVYGLRQAPREWHDTLRTTLVALEFAPSSTDPSLFLRTDTTLPSFCVLVYVDDLVFATNDTEALALVKAELQERHTCTDLGELRSYLGLQITRDRARRTITLTKSHMVHQVLHRFAFQFSSPQPTPLSTGHSLSAPPLDESVEPSVHRAWGSCLEDRVLWYSQDTPTFLGPTTSCEAEIYAGAMAAQELRWLTYLLTNLGERPRSPPVLYVDNKAMLALCHAQRLEHRTKHIALPYFLARELQQRRQLRLSYVALLANTADVFTKALGSSDYQRFCTGLGLVPTLPHMLVA